MIKKIACRTLIMLTILLILIPSTLAFNDPGHDELYIESSGDSILNGSLEITNRFYSDYLDILGNGTILGSSNRILGTATDLYIESPYDVVFNGLVGTSNTIYFGNDPADNVNLNVTGDIIVKAGKNISVGNLKVCLSDGTNCIGGNNTGNVSSVTAGNGISVSGTKDITVNVDTTSISACTGTGDKIIWDSGNNRLTCGTDQDSISGTGASNRIAFWTGSGTISYDNNITWDNTNKRLGIGTTTPNQKLDVNGGINISDANGKIYTPELCLAGDCKTSWPSATGTSLWTNSSGNATFVNGNVGIGTSSPASKLHVVADSSANALRLEENSGGEYMDLALGSAGSLFVKDDNLNNIITIADGSPANSIYVSTTGVGIGKASPGEALEVNGNINVTTGNDICIQGGKCLSTTGTGNGDVTAVNIGSNQCLSGDCDLTTLDGSGSGLDADLLDGYNSLGQLPANSDSSTYTGSFDFNDITTPGFYYVAATSSSNAPEGAQAYWYGLKVTKLSSQAVFQEAYKHENGAVKKFFRLGYNLGSTPAWTSWGKVWHAGNDGSGSGLDADTLDGVDSTSFLQSESDTLSSVLTRGNSAGTTSINMNGQDILSANNVQVNGAISHSSGGTVTVNDALQVNGPGDSSITGGLSISGTLDPNGAVTLPTTGISGAGSGSGLDADLLDGQNGAYYLDNTDYCASGTCSADIQVNGNDIKDSSGTARVSFSSGDVIITLG